MPVVDASVLGSAAIRTDVNRAAARQWLATALLANVPVFAPALAISELASAVRRATGRPELAAAAVRGFGRRRSVRYIEDSRELCERAAVIAAEQNIRGCDAIYVALAQQLAEPLVTFDGDQAKRARALVEVIVPA